MSPKDVLAPIPSRLPDRHPIGLLCLQVHRVVYPNFNVTDGVRRVAIPYRLADPVHQPAGRITYLLPCTVPHYRSSILDQIRSQVRSQACILAWSMLRDLIRFLSGAVVRLRILFTRRPCTRSWARWLIVWLSFCMAFHRLWQWMGFAQSPLCVNSLMPSRYSQPSTSITSNRRPRSVSTMGLSPHEARVPIPNTATRANSLNFFICLFLIII